ncbi:MAG: hypothetical protein DLM63_06050 [Solirubrobacterales bacterium]|nr:MAG: hypothetical protein DLM63_06050 [Solirubrobacterales bacterium]
MDTAVQDLPDRRQLHLGRERVAIERQLYDRGEPVQRGQRLRAVTASVSYPPAAGRGAPRFRGPEHAVAATTAAASRWHHGARLAS